MLEQSVVDGFMSLERSLREDYPGGNTAWMNERNLTQHVGFQLQQSGFAVFCEAAVQRRRSESVAHGRLDVVAVSRDKFDAVVALESKRLHTSKGNWAADLANDVERTRRYLRGYHYLGYQRGGPSVRLGGALALAFHEPVADWWQALAAAPNANDGWTKLDLRLKRAGAVRGRVQLWPDDYMPQAARDGVARWALYALWQQ